MDLSFQSLIFCSSYGPYVPPSLPEMLWDYIFHQSSSDHMGWFEVVYQMVSALWLCLFSVILIIGAFLLMDPRKHQGLRTHLMLLSVASTIGLVWAVYLSVSLYTIEYHAFFQPLPWYMYYHPDVLRLMLVLGWGLCGHALIISAALLPRLRKRGRDIAAMILILFALASAGMGPILYLSRTSALYMESCTIIAQRSQDSAIGTDLITQKWLLNNPNRWEVVLIRADTLRRLRRDDEARALYQMLLTMLPEDCGPGIRKRAIKFAGTESPTALPASK